MNTPQTIAETYKGLLSNPTAEDEKILAEYAQKVVQSNVAIRASIDAEAALPARLKMAGKVVHDRAMQLDPALVVSEMHLAAPDLSRYYTSKFDVNDPEFQAAARARMGI